MISHGVEISIAGGGVDEKDEGNRGRSSPYIEGNPSTAFAARLIPQYESHIRVTKETIQLVVNLTKEIPHSNRVTKERTPKLSQQVSHQGTVRHAGWTIRPMAQTLNISRSTIQRLSKEGQQGKFQPKQRSGRPRIITPIIRQKLVSVATASAHNHHLPYFSLANLVGVRISAAVV